MAVYRIYPEKDTTIWSKPTAAGDYGNGGLDEVLEIRSYPDDDGIGRSSRILTKFKDRDITSAINTKVSGAYSASLHLYLANAIDIPVEYLLQCHPISQSWDSGVGKIADSPVNKTGTNWEYRLAGNTSAWNNLGGDFISGSYSNEQRHFTDSKHDINFDVTSFIAATQAGTIDNHGLIIKLQDSQENETTSSIKLQYFGVDTNTIFPPYLEFKWDDSSYSSALSTLSTDIATVSIKNHKGKYTDSDKIRFRISARPKYPSRTFSTSSIYLTEYKLPQNTYWAIKDEYSEEMIIDFDTTYTKVSADDTSSYFDIFMDGLQPERYYRLLLKTELAGSTVVIDNNNVFKVVRNG
jgi:hypothetical protein